MNTKLIIAAIFILLTNIGFAQVTTQQDSTKVITKLDGTEYVGIILNDDGREVLIETDALGNIYISKSEIKNIQDVKHKKDLYRSDGPFTTRYAYSNNALPITKNENYSIINLYGPEAHFAVTNHLTIGAVTTWILSPLVATLKYSIPTSNENRNYSVGTSLGTTTYMHLFKGYGGLHLASMTIGSKKTNFTISGGYGYYDNGKSINAEGVYINTDATKEIKPILHGPYFALAGIYKLGAKSSLIFDSMGFIYNKHYTLEHTVRSDGHISELTGLMIWDTRTLTVSRREILSVMTLVSSGFRYQKDETHAFQISLTVISFLEEDTRIFPFPMCSWFYKF